MTPKLLTALPKVWSVLVNIGDVSRHLSKCGSELEKWWTFSLLDKKECVPKLSLSWNTAATLTKFYRGFEHRGVCIVWPHSTQLFRLYRVCCMKDESLGTFPTQHTEAKSAYNLQKCAWIGDDLILFENASTLKEVPWSAIRILGQFRQTSGQLPRQ